jgi:Periplasmic binding protein
VRICSLLPSATEIVAALGLADRLVGVSAECDWPREVRGLPVVTAARIDTSELGSLEIDRAVREAIADGRSLYAIDEELIDALGPDLILTQDLCEVCAVSSAEVSRLCKVDAEVISLDPRTIAEIEESVLRLAGRLGVPDRGAAVVADMRAKSAAPASSSPVRAVWRAPRRRHGRRRTHRPLVHHATMMPPRARPTGSASGASTSSLPLRPPRFATPDGERKTPTAMSFAVGPSLYPHRSTALEENDI